MEYYASIRKDEYSTFVLTWVGLEESMLSEISQAESQLSYCFAHLWSIRNNTEDMERWGGEVSWGKLEGETNHERLWTLRNKQGFGGERGGELGEPRGGYYGGHILHGALGVVHKQ